MRVNWCQLETTGVNSALYSVFDSLISSLPVMQKLVVDSFDLPVSCHQGRIHRVGSSLQQSQPWTRFSWFCSPKVCSGSFLSRFERRTHDAPVYQSICKCTLPISSADWTVYTFSHVTASPDTMIDSRVGTQWCLNNTHYNVFCLPRATSLSLKVWLSSSVGSLGMRLILWKTSWWPLGLIRPSSLRFKRWLMKETRWTHLFHKNALRCSSVCWNVLVSRNE